MELLHHGEKHSWASILGYNFPQTFSTNSVESLDQVDIGEEQVDILFLTFLLQLPRSKHHVDGSIAI